MHYQFPDVSQYGANRCGGASRTEVITDFSTITVAKLHDMFDLINKLKEIYEAMHDNIQQKMGKGTTTEIPIVEYQ